MRRILVLLLIAILSSMPVMGMARQALFVSQDAQPMSDAQDMQDMPCHQSAPKPQPASSGDCDSCKSASLCCAAFMPPAPIVSARVDVGAIRISKDAGITVGIVIPPLDPPPLAL